MSNALYIAATGMQVEQTHIDVIANNVANTNTTAYPRSRGHFQDLIYQTSISPGAKSSDTGTTVPTGLQMGLGAQVVSVYKVFEQGPVISTPGDDLNLAIDGPGFLQVQVPGGDSITAYTRDGVLARSNTGELVTSQGYTIIPSITIEQGAQNLTISKDGLVQYTISGVATQAGQIQLADFINPAGLEAMGNNLFKSTDGSGDAVIGTPGGLGFGKILQHYLENSNVNSITEISELIKAQRAFEFNSKIIQASEEISKIINNSKA